MNTTEAIEKSAPKTLIKSQKQITIGSLERALLKTFPAADAEEWDRTGLLVGDRSKPVSCVAVALDPTVPAIQRAEELGAEVLITHHPAYLHAPERFGPAPSAALDPGAGIWAAIKTEVALMDFHTALDVSKQAQQVLPGMLGFSYKGQVICPLPSSKQKGYGQLCRVSAGKGSGETLEHIAARCTSVFGRAPRVWGDMASSISVIATATGSAGPVARQALIEGADCLICGEIKYHDALDLSLAGLCIIELGHDISELPLTAVLAKAIADAGVDKDAITILDQSGNWRYAEAIRI